MLEAVFKPGVRERLAGDGPLVVELGPGTRRRVEGAVTFDRVDGDAVDVVCDLDAGIPLPDARVDAFHSSHFLEHVSDLEAFMRELHRTLRPGGRVVSTVPHFANPWFHSDYTHTRAFGLYTMSYFGAGEHPFRRRVPTFYNELDFRVCSVRLLFRSRIVWLRPLRALAQWLANLGPATQELYEEWLCYWLPPYEIEFVLEKPSVAGPDA